MHRQLLYTTISVTVSAQRTVTTKAALLLSAFCVGNILPLINNKEGFEDEIARLELEKARLEEEKLEIQER